ncbi:MBL fold metallo-hydrolase [Chitinivibrio alkaliphilus]|uniref:Beta-lactamase domain-containing protein n=1 Tax=Chitinivibrio alkaliphilus ACht1 TaxID=1313304 RepID=U7D9F7_9BACT|nr:MBL fold metallo-hydrolase [Chitinivibrio alkaliphilus]ERP39024.1 beta-lactamase domain-containing protein [Chitinivibrio alkaliphilus ACht1]
MKTALTFLGTGTSHGVPTVDCMMEGFVRCPKGVCQESAEDHRHRRLRSSLFVRYGETAVLIDATPDFREQMLTQNISRMDGVVITHKHVDHILGIPDLRSYSKARSEGLPIYGSSETIQAIRESFAYIFDPHTVVGGGIPRLHEEVVTEPFSVGEILFEPIRVEHGACRQCYGYRFNDIAYLPDMKAFYPGEEEKIRGVRLLIIDCLRTERPHSTHLILPEAIAIAQKAEAKNTLFTHMCHGIHYKHDQRYLFPNMDFAFDGLSLEV